jgi:hypothetical protein
MAAGIRYFPAVTGSLAIKLGIYEVLVCELAQFLEKNLGNNSRLRG